MMCMDALDRYDESLPLENFLSVHVRRRLLNFRRDKFVRKRTVLETEKIDYIEDKYLSVFDSTLVGIEDSEIFKYIDQNLPREYREDYCKYLDGISLPTKSRRRLFAKIEELLNG